MKVTKKILSIALVLLLALSAVSGLAISASGLSELPVENVDLHIHKGDIPQNGENDTAGNALIGTTDDLTGTENDKPANFTGLKGAVFEIYYVGPLGTAAPATADVSKYELKKTVVTDENGDASFTVIKNYGDQYVTADGPHGLYYVREVTEGTIDGQTVKASSKITKLSAPFFVNLPMTAQNTSGQPLDTTSGATITEGEDWLLDIDVYPKNLTTLGGATLTKTINGKMLSELTDDENDKLTEYPKFILYRKGENSNPDTAISSEIQIDFGALRGNGILEDVKDTYDAADIRQKGSTIAVDGLPVGTYIFKETTAAVYDGQTLPLAPNKEFTVTAGYNYKVIVDPDSNDFGKITAVTGGGNPAQFELKVDNASTPIVTKSIVEDVKEYTVTDPDDNTKTVSAKTFIKSSGTDQRFIFDGNHFKYKISITSPTDIKSYKNYVITDQIDSQIIVCDNANYRTVKCGETNFVESGETTDYAWQIENNKITISFTATGIQKITPGTPVDITFACAIKDTAAINTGIKNTAKLAWTNGADRSGDSTSNPVYVAALGYTMAKVDSEKRAALAGAEFELYRITEDYVDGTTPVQSLPKVYFTEADGVYKASYNFSGTANEVDIKSSVDGMIKIEGLGGGTYKLVETKAPNGYQLLTAPITITVDENSGKEITDLTATSIDIARIVPNVPQPELPITGGMGTLLFTVGGLLLSGGAVFAYVWFKKRRANEEKA